MPSRSRSRADGARRARRGARRTRREAPEREAVPETGVAHERRPRLARRAQPLAGGRLRARADEGAARRARRPAAALPRRPRRRDERQVDGDRHDRAAAARGRAARRRDGLAARALVGRADPARRAARQTSPAALARIRPAAERVGATQFESITAAALTAFADAGVDVAVVEAGLGGRHDATNVLRSRVVLLTNVGLEHTDVLGETVEADRGGEACCCPY